MKTCDKCKLSVAGTQDKCPLCESTLRGQNQAGEDVFPFIPLVSRKHNVLLRIMQLCSAVAVIVSALVNYLMPETGFWSLFVGAGVACLWLSLIVSIRKRGNILKNLSYQVTIVSILSVLWDVFMGWRGWSVDFVIPIAFITGMFAIAVLARILRMETENHIVYSLLLVLYGIIPFVFVASGLSNVPLPALICVACSLVLLAALLIFEGRKMTEEMKRRLHL